MRTQLSFITYGSVNYLYHVVHYITSSYLSYNWNFLPFDYLHLILPPPTLVQGFLIFCFVSGLLGLRLFRLS